MLQREAQLLKGVKSGGSNTKVIAVGITGGVSVTELRTVASAPHQMNVILAHDFTDLLLVKQQLSKETCKGNVSVLLETLTEASVSVSILMLNTGHYIGVYSFLDLIRIVCKKWFLPPHALSRVTPCKSDLVRKSLP